MTEAEELAAFAQKAFPEIVPLETSPKAVGTLPLDGRPETVDGDQNITIARHPRRRRQTYVVIRNIQ